MIQIHRSEPLTYVEDKPVKLTPAEHRMLITLGMMDNRIAPFDLLLDVKCEDRVQVPSDRQALASTLHRLRKKIGSNRLLCVKHRGYMLLGHVRFIGSPAGQE